MRIISDIHGKYTQYLNLTKNQSLTIQLGDLGFDYNPINHLNPNEHKRIGGNHDNYTKVNDEFIYMNSGHWLGDYGMFNNIFFLRGAKSIDKAYRIEGKSWWKDEELSYTQLYNSIEVYQSNKPEIVITHDCPAFLCDQVSNIRTFDGVLLKPSSTAHLLERLFTIHQPKLWIFGHYHKRWNTEIKGTYFQCLEECGYLDLDNGKPVQNDLESLIPAR